jgi:hypothetical protein
MDILKELKKKEKFYFDTYKNNRSNLDKANHLIAMAAVIMEIHKLEQSQKKNNMKKYDIISTKQFTITTGSVNK